MSGAARTAGQVPLIYLAGGGAVIGLAAGAAIPLGNDWGQVNRPQVNNCAERRALQAGIRGSNAARAG